MPLFQMDGLSQSGLLKSEMAECDAFLEGRGISMEMATHDPEGTRQRSRQYLEECVNQNRFNKVWVYQLLATFYFMEGRFEEVVSVYSRAASEHPTDPRAYYGLGTIYYGYYTISGAREDERTLQGPDIAYWPMEMQERMRRSREFQEENQQLIKALLESKLAASPEEAAKLALQYFRKTLECHISNEDRRRVQTHIRLIEMELSL